MAVRHKEGVRYTSHGHDIESRIGPSSSVCEDRDMDHAHNQLRNEESGSRYGEHNDGPVSRAFEPSELKDRHLVGA